MGEKIFECEYSPGEEIVMRFRPPRLKMVPAATRNHIRVAHKELLLALRSLIDGAIEAIERREKSEKEEKKRKKIEVE